MFVYMKQDIKYPNLKHTFTYNPITITTCFLKMKKKNLTRKQFKNGEIEEWGGALHFTQSY